MKILVSITGIVLLVVLNILTAGSAYAQQPLEQWVARYDGGGYDYADGIVVDDLGNVYITGISDGQGGKQYATIKYDKAGNQLWVARYPTSQNEKAYFYADPQIGKKRIALDGNGNVYVVGSIEDSSDNTEYVIIKYSANGQLLWDERYSYGDEENVATAMTVDSVGNVYVTGFSFLDMTYEIVFATLKYDADGNLIWHKYHRAEFDFNYPTAIGVDSNGNAIVTGFSVSREPDLLDDTVDEAASTTIKYDANGAKLWSKDYHVQNNLSLAIDLGLDRYGNIYITGYFGVLESLGYATIKYDTAGTSLWVAHYQGSEEGSLAMPEKMVVDDAGNVYITGSLLNIGETSDTTTSSYATVKYCASGNQMWTAHYEGPAGISFAADIALDSRGNVFVAGTSMDRNINDTAMDYATVKYDNYGNQMWVARYEGPSDSNHGKAIAADGNGSVYVTGHSKGRVGRDDYATIKYSTPHTLGFYDHREGRVYIKYDHTPGSADATYRLGPRGNDWLVFKGDWNGDGRDTFGFYDQSDGQVYVKYDHSPGPADSTYRLGPRGNNWVVSVGDFNADGRDTFGFYDRAEGRVYVKYDHTPGPADATYRLGPRGNNWAVLVGDFNNNGFDTFGFYDWTKGQVYVKNDHSPGPADNTYRLGPRNNNWGVGVRDWNGDGRDTFGFYDRAAGRVYVKFDHSPGPADATYRLGPRGNDWVVLAGDFNSDGKETFGFYNRSEGRVYVKYDHTPGAADATYRLGPRGNNWEVLVGRWQ